MAVHRIVDHVGNEMNIEAYIIYLIELFVVQPRAHRAARHNQLCLVHIAPFIPQASAAMHPNFNHSPRSAQHIPSRPNTQFSNGLQLRDIKELPIIYPSPKSAYEARLAEQGKEVDDKYDEDDDDEWELEHEYIDVGTEEAAGHGMDPYLGAPTRPHQIRRESQDVEFGHRTPPLTSDARAWSWLGGERPHPSNERPCARKDCYPQVHSRRFAPYTHHRSLTCKRVAALRVQGPAAGAAEYSPAIFGACAVGWYCSCHSGDEDRKWAACAAIRERRLVFLEY